MIKKVKVGGMHCASCEVFIERRFKKISGVEKTHSNHETGETEIICSREPTIEELQESVKDTEYKVHLSNAGITRKKAFDDYFEITAYFIIVIGVFYFLKQADLLPNIGITDNMSYWVVFLIGLVAATSTCLAVAGGLLLAVAAKYNEMYPNLSVWQKFKPNIYFNIGRIVSYTALGAIIGTFGSILTLSPKMNGFLTIMASIVMILLGFQLIKIFPWLNRFQPKMPKFLSHKIHDSANKEHWTAPFLLGASTFFLPCGFTMALQLYALSTGNALTGALTMLVFSLGTLPSLLSLGAISSCAKGAFQKDFLKFAGVVIILLGIFNISNGLALTGMNFDLFPSTQATASPTENNIGAGNKEQNAQIIDGKQIVQMKVIDLNYVPSRFNLVQGIPAEWQVDASMATGCAQVIAVPKLGIVKYLSPNEITKIEFVPKNTGRISFSCTMGMTTSGASFNVVENAQGIPAAPLETKQEEPKIESSGQVQKLSMEISTERGFYPNTFTVKKDVPVELEIDAKVQLKGCMSTMVIPEFKVAHLLKLGKSTLKFTPDKEGVFPFTCSMGGKMGKFIVEA